MPISPRTSSHRLRLMAQRSRLVRLKPFERVAAHVTGRRRLLGGTSVSMPGASHDRRQPFHPSRDGSHPRSMRSTGSSQAACWRPIMGSTVTTNAGSACPRVRTPRGTREFRYAPGHATRPSHRCEGEIGPSSRGGWLGPFSVIPQVSGGVLGPQSSQCRASWTHRCSHAVHERLSTVLTCSSRTRLGTNLLQAGL